MNKKDGKAKTRPNGDMNAVAIANRYGISTKEVFRTATKSYQRNHWKKDDVKYRVGHSVFFKYGWIKAMFPAAQDLEKQFSLTTESENSCVAGFKQETPTIHTHDYWIRSRQLEIVRFLRSHNTSSIVDAWLQELEDLFDM